MRENNEEDSIWVRFECEAVVVVKEIGKLSVAFYANRRFVCLSVFACPQFNEISLNVKMSLYGMWNMIGTWAISQKFDCVIRIHSSSINNWFKRRFIWRKKKTFYWIPFDNKLAAAIQYKINLYVHSRSLLLASKNWFEMNVKYFKLSTFGRKPIGMWMVLWDRWFSSGK